MRRGIPELGITEPEPIIIDEIGIALGSGPDGYRASFRNIQAYGVSNITVTGVRYVNIFFILSFLSLSRSLSYFLFRFKMLYYYFHVWLLVEL